MTSLNGQRQNLRTRSCRSLSGTSHVYSTDGLRKSDALTLVAWAMPLEATFALKPPLRR
ncbi:MAG: hypothetical protein HY707_04465 [Ignavibacteriae bacterium]|nr:hypothetical protein [Ignavibacteriota bacterium]